MYIIPCNCCSYLAMNSLVLILRLLLRFTSPSPLNIFHNGLGHSRENRMCLFPSI